MSEFVGMGCGTPSEAEMRLIRAVGASAEVAADELFVFAVDLCDDRIDREGERFTVETLRGLAPLFVGRPGIFDHEWSAHEQRARLFATEVVEEGGRTVLRGRAYMLRDGNGALIREIEAGIKREVSVGVAVREKRCSICGGSDCAHVAGRTYGGRLCTRELVGAVDAYEFSFVAVPAQRGAGVNLSAYRVAGRSRTVETPREAWSLTRAVGPMMRTTYVPASAGCMACDAGDVAARVCSAFVAVPAQKEAGVNLSAYKMGGQDERHRTPASYNRKYKIAGK